MAQVLLCWLESYPMHLSQRGLVNGESSAPVSVLSCAFVPQSSTVFAVLRELMKWS